jgi:hypothetical protein
MNKVQTKRNENHVTFAYKSKYKNIFITLIFRMILFFFATYNVYFLTCTMLKPFHYFLLIFSVIILIDTAYIVIKRNGLDFEWLVKL